MSFMDAREHGAKMGTGFVSESQAVQPRPTPDANAGHKPIGRCPYVCTVSTALLFQSSSIFSLLHTQVYLE